MTVSNTISCAAAAAALPVQATVGQLAAIETTTIEQLIAATNQGCDIICATAASCRRSRGTQAGEQARRHITCHRSMLANRKPNSTSSKYTLCTCCASPAQNLYQYICWWQQLNIFNHILALKSNPKPHSSSSCSTHPTSAHTSSTIENP